MRLMKLGTVIVAGLIAATLAAVACGGDPGVVEKVVTVEVEKIVQTKGDTVVQTVVVERPVTVTEKVIETVIVEKVVEGKTVMEVQTVVVERPVTVTEKVVETVIVEKVVEGKTVMEVQTVVVERPVTVIEKVVETVVVEKAVIVKEEVIREVEKVVVATPSLFDAQEILAAADGRRGGTLRVVSQASIGTIDPISSSAWVAWAVSSQIYDVPFAADGVFQPQLQMLEDWSISPDGLVWSFTIRDGLQWHDGTRSRRKTSRPPCYERSTRTTPDGKSLASAPRWRL